MIMTVSVITAATYLSPLIVHHMQSFGFTTNIGAVIFTLPTMSCKMSFNIKDLISLGIVPKLS
jgi:hypothetical protein